VVELVIGGRTVGNAEQGAAVAPSADGNSAIGAGLKAIWGEQERHRGGLAAVRSRGLKHTT
jgi:hypothetical protein